MNIICDIDDTILPLVDTWLKHYNWVYNDTLNSNQITDWSISQFVKPECGNKIYQFLTLPDLNLYDEIRPFENALESITILRSLGHRVIFVTRLDPFNRKYDWLLKWKFLSDNKDYVVAEDKHLVKATVMIDDRWDYIKEFDGLGVLVNQPWNMKYDHYPRAATWNGIMNVLKKKEIV